MDPNLTNNANLNIRPSDILDIRHLTETGDELKKKILVMIDDTQSPLLITPLPNLLVMTGRQYDQMQTDPDMLGRYSESRIYVTPLNAMDVRVWE